MPTIRRFLAASVVSLLLAACGTSDPAGPGDVNPNDAPALRAPVRSMQTGLPPECGDSVRSERAADLMVPLLFKPGGGRWITAILTYNEMLKAKKKGNAAGTRAAMQKLIDMVLDEYWENNLIGGKTAAVQARATRLIYLLYCTNNIQPIPDLTNLFDARAVLVRPTTQDTVVTDTSGTGGVKINQGDVPDVVNGQPFLGTFISVIRSTEPLPTSLDWYGGDGFKAGAFQFIAEPAVVFDNPVLAGVCISYDDAIVPSPSDLRLAHGVDPQTYTPTPGGVLLTTPGGSIEILEAAATDPLNLECTPLPFQSISMWGRAADGLASIFLPQSLLAATTGGGRGGNVREFSPFAAVDRVLTLSGSAPTSGEITPPATSITVTANASVATRHPSALTPIPDVAVAFAPGAKFAPSATSTDAAGAVTSQWTLFAGANSGTATPSRAGLAFQPASVEFQANVTVKTPPAPPLAITTASPLPDVKKGKQVLVKFEATGGTGPYTWSLKSGKLPRGVSFYPEYPKIYGTPSETGTFSFTIQVKSGGVTAVKAFTLGVKK